MIKVGVAFLICQEIAPHDLIPLLPPLVSQNLLNGIQQIKVVESGIFLQGVHN